MTTGDGLPPALRWRASVVILVGIGMSVLDGSLVNLVLPTLATELKVTPASAIWVINAFQLAVLCLLLPLASLGDRVGYRRVYLVGLVLFTAASLGCALSSDLPWLVGMRLLQGMGAAGMMSVNMALVRQVYPSAVLGRGIARNSMVVATMSVAGPSIAALVLSVASWPWLFAVNVPVGVLLLWLGREALPPSTRRDGARIHPLDVLLNVLTFGLVFLGVDGLSTREASHSAWLSVPHAAVLLAAGLLFGVVYVRRQLRLPLPLLPLDLLRIRMFALSICTSASAFCAQMLAFIALPFLLLGQFGRSHWQAGLLIMAWPFTTIGMAPLAGRLIGRYPAWLLCALGLGTMSCGLALLAYLPAQPHDADIVWRMLLCGAGFGLFQSPNNHAIITSAPAQRSGGAGGVQSSARLVGQMVGAICAAAVFSQWLPSQGLGPSMALGLASTMAAVAAVFSLTRVLR